MNELDPATFALEVPLYRKIKITDENSSAFEFFFKERHSFSGYSPILKENTTFTLDCKNAYGGNIYQYLRYGGYGSATLTCLRDSSIHEIFYHYNPETEVFQKVGQYLSIADFHISKIKEYDKLLSKDDLKEFAKAIGLAANGIGIGSFVYLRRIFEGLIEEAHSKEKLIEGWKEDIYRNAKMADKIGMLKHNLPEFLVRNKELYSILSNGIHELTEDECLNYFNIVKDGIEQILDEKLHEHNKNKKQIAAQKAIAELKSKIGSKK